MLVDRRDQLVALAEALQKTRKLSGAAAEALVAPEPYFPVMRQTFEQETRDLLRKHNIHGRATKLEREALRRFNERLDGQ
jgi:hypothetical protein